jgi:hypothetical protein
MLTLALSVAAVAREGWFSDFVSDWFSVCTEVDTAVGPDCTV